MARFGNFGDLQQLLGPAPVFGDVLDYLRQCFAKGTEAHARIAALAEDTTHRTELRDGVYAMESAYRSRTRGDCFFESHRRYIDVQAIVEGEEFIEVAHVERLHVAVAYDEARDLVKYSDFDFASRLRLGSGDIAVFNPADGHMPCLRTDAAGTLVRKTVVKVPVPAGFVLPQ